MEEERKQETMSEQSNASDMEGAKTPKLMPLDLPPNVAEFAQLPIKEQKRIYTLSLYLMQAGMLHYFLGFIYLITLLCFSISGNDDTSNHIPLPFLLYFVFFVLLLFALGYTVRNLRSKSANVIIKIYAILGCLGSVGTIFGGLMGNIISSLISVIVLIIYIIIFKATICKEIFSETALSHKQLKYIYKCKKNNEPIEADKLPKGL